MYEIKLSTQWLLSSKLVISITKVFYLINAIDNCNFLYMKERDGEMQK